MWQPTADLRALKRRAQMLSTIRKFFAERDILEVTTPVLQYGATTDLHLVNLTTELPTNNTAFAYLHTSPELSMKRLLAAGCGSIYQICPVFRGGDVGNYHRTEFTMLEWYRPGQDYQQLMSEVQELIFSANGGPLPIKRFTYQELFLHYLDFDPLQATLAACHNCCRTHNIDTPESMGDVVDDWLDLILSTLVVPKLPESSLIFVVDYPASQASLAKLRNEQEYKVAERFEVYWGSTELANGYQELTDAKEQQLRFAQQNQQRERLSLPTIRCDTRFIQSLESGMPAAAGVALGIDRLLMKIVGVDNIKSVMAFADDLH